MNSRKANMPLTESLPATLHFIADGCLLLNPQGKILDINESFCKYLSYEKESILQKNLSELIAEPQVQKEWLQNLQAREEYAELNLLHKTGRRVTLELSLNKVPDSQNILCICRQRHNGTGRSTKEIETHYRQLFEANLDGIAIFLIGKNGQLSAIAELNENAASLE